VDLYCEPSPWERQFLCYVNLGLKDGDLEELKSDLKTLRPNNVQLEDTDLAKLMPYIISGLQGLFLGKANGLGLIGEIKDQLPTGLKEYTDNVRNALLTDLNALKIQHIKRESFQSTSLSFYIDIQTPCYPLRMRINPSGYLYFYLHRYV